MAQKQKKQVGSKPKPVLDKIVNQIPLTKEDKKYLKKLIKVLEKSYEDKKLNESDQQKINELREMAKRDMGSFLEYLRTCGSFLHLLHLFDKT